jgi:hypothetical protein
MEMPGDATEQVNQANEKIVHGLKIETRDPDKCENGFKYSGN